MIRRHRREGEREGGKVGKRGKKWGGIKGNKGVRGEKSGGGGRELCVFLGNK